MKISYNWLKQFIKLDWSPEKTAELLTNLGLEVEGIEKYTSVPGGLEGIVVGHVTECTKHPNADRLKLTKVDLGNGEPVQIVCGAPNVATGQKVPVATVGTTLYTAEGEPWNIKKGKIRGEVSMGMICAEDELGLGQSHDGIMVLDNDLPPGKPASELFDIENDVVFEIGLTPNRADAMSHWGVARDLRAGLLQENITLELITPSTSSFHVDNRTLKIDVDVADLKKAPRYCGVTISGLSVEQSPAWLQNRLQAIGLTPINNIVDITNYVCHDLGQPLHAFDAAKIKGSEVNVKTLPKGTKFTTLDEVERELHEDDLMICDAEGPMCIAGVFGGANSGVTETTTSIFLESAYFDPVSVRKTAKRHGLNTDASFRFERGIDPNTCKYAMLRAALLIQEIAGGEITSEVVDIYPKRIEDHQVYLNFENASKLIGEEISPEIIKDILNSLDMKVNSVTESSIGMLVPAYRNDVTREVDVIEEILRVYGYNNINFTEKLNASIAITQPVEDYKVQNKVGDQLTALGFNEMMANSLTSPDFVDFSENLKPEHNVIMLNPLSKELSVLRQSMLFGNLEALAYNSNRRMPNVKLFEFGKTYHTFSEKRVENKHLSILISGDKNQDNWTSPAEQAGFFYGKGIVLSILERLGINPTTEKDTKNDIFSEGIAILANKKQIVELGILKKQLTKEFDVEAEVFYADFNWDAVLSSISRNGFLVKPIPKYPQVKRDFALLLDENVSFKELRDAAQQTEKKLLVGMNLFDVYTGKNLPEGKKSYAVSFTLQDDKKTLTDKQIDKIMKKLQQRFEKDFGATLR
ncbi:phenylalanine--tRNA ligase subunit beta [Marixanthomonas spongiae]|uniref:Phenylalanine--tRNA ligase beta subunit n=2 Tax=Marixanthomonas spongiae TaxID=2174845 RepID=A0A2U0I0Q8_9FLAO|nr:phenylalanine--tRNA ligase subunit beta [Marixanthomonas spongiae]PVW14684.1 phenylalanine--tRNA ligase subunit beta [Marixanthomonas spongiae]